MSRSTACSESGRLYVLATPIGNLNDITARATDILATCNIVAGRVTQTGPLRELVWRG